jgi:hypothetical protein
MKKKDLMALNCDIGDIAGIVFPESVRSEPEGTQFTKERQSWTERK